MIADRLGDEACGDRGAVIVQDRNEPHRVNAVLVDDHGSKLGVAVLLDRLRIRAFPFHSSVASFIAAHDFVYVVEQNRDAQLRSLLVNENGIDPVRLIPILHYDGTPVTARFIAGAIGDHQDQLKVTPLRKVKT